MDHVSQGPSPHIREGPGTEHFSAQTNEVLVARKWEGVDIGYATENGPEVDMHILKSRSQPFQQY